MLTVWMMYGIPEWMVWKGFWMIGLELEIWVVECWFLYYCVCVNDKTYFCWALANIPVHSLLVWLITPSFFHSIVILYLVHRKSLHIVKLGAWIRGEGSLDCVGSCDGWCADLRFAKCLGCCSLGCSILSCVPEVMC